LNSHLRPFLFILLIFISIPAFTQENIEKAADDTLYIINSYFYIVDGITRPYALNYKTNFYEGELITGFSVLEKFILEKTQLLLNERVLEKAEIEYTIGEINENGIYPVDLVIKTKDTWNIIAIPYPKYDDNTGFSITLKARDYNFLGTMSPLRLDLGYELDIDGYSTFSLMLDTNIPLRFFGIYWDIDFDHDLLYRAGQKEPWFYKNTTGISAEFPFNANSVKIGFSESLYLNEKNPDAMQLSFTGFQEGIYLSSRPYVSFYIPTGVKFYNYGEITYRPEFSAVFNHELPLWPLDEFRKGPFLYFSHSIDLGRVDWIENFRKGVSININNSFDYSFYNKRNNELPLSANLEITAASHFLFSDFAGLSFRLMYRHSFLYGSYDSAGNVLRGFLDNSIKAKYMISLNLDFPVRILQVRPSNWSENNKILRIFDFDLHMIPIIDFAFFNAPEIHSSFDINNLLISGGMELIIFPQRWRSLFLRISLGFGMQLLNPAAGVTRELFIGMELYY